MYHVGRPGHERTMDRILKAWGIDGHNSHTNVCSSSARLGYALWSGYDRPSPDHANARFILLLSSHLESGHYFNPHAQRIIEGKLAGAKLAVMDPRLSNTASMADFWLPTYPGSEAAVLLAMARILLDEGLADLDYLENWTNWREYMADRHHGQDATFAAFVAALKEHYAEFTPEFAEAESGVPRERIVEVARLIGAARGAFASHVWRGAASGNEGGWQVARALQFLTVLTASVGTAGGTSPHAWNKYKPMFWEEPPGQKEWNELLFPREWPLSHYEMSFLLPHFLKEGRGRLDTYFTRVYNPVWTNPDGMTWMEVLQDESLVGLHAALTPTWSETAAFADYVLPDGPRRRAPRHPEPGDAVRALGELPPARAARRPRAHGRDLPLHLRGQPGRGLGRGRVLDRALLADRSRRRAGDPPLLRVALRGGGEADRPRVLPVDLRELGARPARGRGGRRPHAVRVHARNGAFLIEPDVTRAAGEAPATAPRGGSRSDGKRGVGPASRPRHGSSRSTPGRWSTGAGPTRRCPATSRATSTARPWTAAAGRWCCCRPSGCPRSIHTRSGNAKYLNEISHRNPLWIHTSDAERLGLETGDLVRVTTEIGYFVNRVWVTESIAPGVVACSHHLGRWRLHANEGSRWSTPRVRFSKVEGGTLLRQVETLGPFESADPDSSRIWWSDGGVHQNLTFAVHPDPISGMHCWHQKVVVGRAPAADRYGDVFVQARRGRWRSTASGWPGRSRLRGPEGCGGRSGWTGRCVRPRRCSGFRRRTPKARER